MSASERARFDLVSSLLGTVESACAAPGVWGVAIPGTGTAAGVGTGTEVLSLFCPGKEIYNQTSKNEMYEVLCVTEISLQKRRCQELIASSVELHLSDTTFC